MDDYEDRRRGAPLLRVTGLVERPAQWRCEELAVLPGQVADAAGEAVSAEAVLQASGPRGRYVSVESEGAAYRASIPIEELSDKGVLVYGWESGGLPVEKGGPFRILIPGGRTLCWNVKGVAQLRVTAEPEPDSVPANPTH